MDILIPLVVAAVVAAGLFALFRMLSSPKRAPGTIGPSHPLPEGGGVMMIDAQKKAELQSAAEAALFATEFAAANIRKYLQMHGGLQGHYVMKIADESHYVMKIADDSHYVMKIADDSHYVMKIADDTRLEMEKIVEASVDLAAANLQEFMRQQKGTRP